MALRCESTALPMLDDGESSNTKLGANGAEEKTKRQPDTLRSRETGLSCVCLGGDVSGGNFPDKPPSDPADGVLSGKNSL